MEKKPNQPKNKVRLDRTIALLEGKGYRLTPQRLIILTDLQKSGDHISAEAIYDKVRRRYPTINVSTIYRTLELLEKLNLVTSTDMGGGTRQYHYIESSKHHHLVCKSCGDIMEFSSSHLQPLKDALDKEYKFKTNLNHLVIYGLCFRCQQKEGGSIRG